MKSKAKTTIRVEHDAQRLHRFLKDHDYPFTWEPAKLQKYCIMLRIEEDRRVVAYTWGNWTDDGVLDFHACAERRLWLTPAVLERLHLTCELFGASMMTTRPHGDTAPAIRRLLTRAGFKETPDGLLYKDLGDDNGYVLKQQAEDL